MKLDRTLMFGAPLLSEGEERAALEAFKRDGCRAALTKLVMSHARMAHAEARRRARGEAEFYDLLASGLLGLVNAAHAFDCDREVRFATFAAYHVRNQVAAQAANLQFPMTVSKHARRAAASDARDAARLTLPEIVDLDAEFGEGGERVRDTLPSDEPTPEERHENSARCAALRTVVSAAIDGLDPLPREIVMRNVLDGQEPLERIAADLGISVERARTLQRRAFTAMRRSLLARGFSPSVLA